MNKNKYLYIFWENNLDVLVVRMVVRLRMFGCQLKNGGVLKHFTLNGCCWFGCFLDFCFIIIIIKYIFVCLAYNYCCNYNCLEYIYIYTIFYFLFYIYFCCCLFVLCMFLHNVKVNEINLK